MQEARVGLGRSPPVLQPGPSAGPAWLSGLVLAAAGRLIVASRVVRVVLESQHLALHQLGIEAALCQQLLVRALLHHTALV